MRRPSPREPIARSVSFVAYASGARQPEPMARTKLSLALGASMAMAATGACDEILEPTPAPAAGADASADVTPTTYVLDAHVEPHLDGAHDAHAGDAHADGPNHHACDGIGLTGSPPNCLLFAHCGHGEFQVDCIDGGGSCRCAAPDGGTAVVSYDPRFCDTGDGASPA